MRVRSFLRGFRVSNERCDGEFADGNCTAEAWAHRRRGLDTGIIPLSLKAELTVDHDTHAVEPDLPRDFMPFVGGDEALILKTVLLCGCRIVHAEFAHRAFPVEDQFASVPVHPQVS